MGSGMHGCAAGFAGAGHCGGSGGIGQWPRDRVKMRTHFGAPSPGRDRSRSPQSLAPCGQGMCRCRGFIGFFWMKVGAILRGAASSARWAISTSVGRLPSFRVRCALDTQVGLIGPRLQGYEQNEGAIYIACSVLLDATSSRNVGRGTTPAAFDGQVSEGWLARP